MTTKLPNKLPLWLQGKGKREICHIEHFVHISIMPHFPRLGGRKEQNQNVTSGISEQHLYLDGI
jgi:hypothetical protein